MPKTRHYPPSQIRYRIEHPPITVHLNKKVKENLNKVKGTRSYAQVVTELLMDTFNLEKEIESLPATEAVIQYIRGFKEGEARYAKSGICSKCHKEEILWSDGKCVYCHKTGLVPDYSYFRDMNSALTVTDEDFEKAKVIIPNKEKMIYDNGRKRGYNEGISEGYDMAESEFKITYPCSVCGKLIVMHPNGKDHVEMKDYMRKNGWHHVTCSNK